MVGSSKQRTLVVFGQGYVGLPLSIAAARSGYMVIGVESDERKLAFLVRGESYVEDVSRADLQQVLSGGNYRPVGTLSSGESFDIGVITVPTPLRDGAPDLSYIERAGDSLAKNLTQRSTVILESTSYPGTTDEFLVPRLERSSSMVAGEDFYVGYSPERVDPGNKYWNLINTPKIVSGINEKSLEIVKDFYTSLGINVVSVNGTREAELAKLLENTFRHVNIALVNELAVFARALGVDVWNAIEAASTKPFGFMKFLPGPGVGGHCLPIDPSYLSWAVKEKTGSSFKFVDLANSINDSMPGFVVSRIQDLLDRSDLTRTNILLIGIAYKPNTGDVRESPALEVFHRLRLLSANVSALDSFVDERLWPEGLNRVTEIDGDCYDIAVILTAHDDLDIASLSALEIPILDTRHSLSLGNVTYL